MTNKLQCWSDATGGFTSMPTNATGRLLVAMICLVGAVTSVAQTTPAPAPTPPQQCNVVPAPGGQTDCGDTASGVGTSSVASMNTNATTIGAGNPINLLTGNKYQKEVDLAPLPGVLGVEIVRHYNSSYTEARHAPGLVGKGWRLSYETQLFADQRLVQIAQADGSRVIFNRDPKNPTQCSSADPGQGKLLIQEGASRIATTYTWVWPGAGSAGGRRLTFNAHGKLTQIAAPTGEVKTLQHEEGAAGRLLKVIDPIGRTLTLSYPAKADATPFKGVQGIQSPVGRFAYAYGAEHALAANAPESEREVTSTQIANLSSMTSPGGVERRYHYEDASHPTKLTGISVGAVVSMSARAEPVQRIASWAYDAEGRAVLSVKGALPKDGEAGVEQVRITKFIAPRHDAPGRAEVVNALGQASVYITQSVQGLPRLVQGNGAGCASCPPTNRRWAYDAVGRLTQETPLSVSGDPITGERFEHDALGRIVRHFALVYPASDGDARLASRSATPTHAAHKRASNNASRKHQEGKPQERLLQRFEYEAASVEPSLVAKPSVVAGLEHTIAFRRNEQGQVTSVIETGYSPIDAEGKPNPTPISRAVSYRYSVVNGHSLLVAIDGPLPNGPRNDPGDSDITTYQYGANGAYLVSMTAPGNRQSKVTYDSAGRIETVINTEGFSTTFKMDAQGQLVQLQSMGPGWQVPITERFKYDAVGHQVEAVRVESAQANGVERSKPQWAKGFDAHGRLAWHASALGVLQQRRHDKESRLVSESRYTNAHAQVNQYHWADDGRLAAVTDNAGRMVNWLHDDQQRPGGFVDTLGRVHTPAQAGKRADASLAPRVFTDDFGQRVQRDSPDSGRTTWWLDLAGQLQSMEDALGNRARYAYDVQGRIAEQVMRDATSQQETTTRWHYEGQRLVRLEHPTQGERYAYDARGLRVARVVTIKASDMEHTAITRYEHDVQGQLTATVLPDGSKLSVQRNGQGQVVALKRTRITTPWLQGLETPQFIVKDLQRDLIGVKHQVAGNGVQSQSVRSAEGSLARVLHRLPKKVMTAKFSDTIRDRITNDKPWKEQVSLATFNAVQVILGVGPAHAAPAGDPATAPSSQANHPSSQPTGSLPGALNEPSDSQAIIDHRYLWDAAGNLRYVQHSAGAPKTSAYAYDMADRLIVARTQNGEAIVPVSTASQASKPERLEQYFHDAQGRRVLAQVDGSTGKTRFDKASHRWVEEASTKEGATQASYDQAGQPRAVGSKTYQWDAAGRLITTTDGPSQTSYAYDHRGLRNSKHTGRQGNQRQITHYLHDEARQLQAELNHMGQLTRQYVYLADQPLATIDTPSGQALSHQQSSKLRQVMQDIATIVKGWVSKGEERITWLHLNHLGAPEAATDSQANVVWQASYLAYGKASVEATGYTLNLRLPGQYEDQESGLHYNRQRYYDPAKGSYLTPDPSGNPDGNNGYAYVRYNPVKYVDPDGLILFAFDGTGNEEALSSTNVWLFSRAYDDNDSEINGGEPYYIQGPGTSDSGVGWLDSAIGYSMSDRIDRQLARLDNYVQERVRLDGQHRAISRDDPVVITLDIIGFSRGAAAARDFSNQLITRRNAGYYRDRRRGFSGDCVTINIRFMGLWDTVLAANASWFRRDFNMNIPAPVQYVAHAVAVNEHRSAFALQSIGSGPETTQQGWRVERGFVGAHADIGGGYNGMQGGDGGDLSDVALNWVYNEAERAGIRMRDLDALQRIVTSPIVHNQRAVYPFCAPIGGAPYFGGPQDRQVISPTGTVAMRQATIAGLTTTQAEQLFVQWNANMSQDPACFTQSNQQGTVNMDAYSAWLDTEYGVRMQ